MIDVRVLTDSSGCLKQLSAAGHSGSSEKGKDILCAAVTVILRTAARVLQGREKTAVTVLADECGQFKMIVQPFPDPDKEWFNGVSDMVIWGLMDLRDEYPGNIRLKLSKED